MAGGIAAGEVPVLAHGPTFMANPLACAAASASIDLLLAGDWRARVARIERGLRARARRRRRRCPAWRTCASSAPSASSSSTTPSTWPGAPRSPSTRGVWLRPFRDLVYAMPPYVSSDDDLAAITRAMRAVAAAA